MSFLVRKITRSKWPDDFCELGEIKADVYADLRTSGNSLSFWQIEEECELEDVMLALATGPNSSLEKVTIAWIDEEELRLKGILVEASEGDTVVDDLRNRHRDVCSLTYTTLGQVSHLLLNAIQGGKCKRFPRSEVENAVVEAAESGRLESARLSAQMLDSLRRKDRLGDLP